MPMRLTEMALRRAQRLVLATSRTPLRHVWALAYRAVAHAVGMLLTRGERGAAVYTRASLEGSELTPGLSDVDLAIVLATDEQADRVRGRWQRIDRGPLRGLVDVPLIYGQAELRALTGRSALTYPEPDLRRGRGVWERRAMSPRHTATLATLVALALSAALAGSALADPIALNGAPLTVYVDELGQIQAKRNDSQLGIFYPSTSPTGDAGFFLAFPDATQTDVAGKVFGFTSAVGPSSLRVEDYTPLSRSATTGAGTAVLTQVTKYAVRPTPPANVAEVTQTTTYTNGSQQFSLRWDVKNTSDAPLKLKALAAADFFFDGSDKGTGIYTDGPPRFIGGTNADTGNSGGFAEVTGAGSTSPPWTKYEALAYGPGTDEVWGKVEHAADSTAPSFSGNVVGEPVDNAGGVEWDQYLALPIPAGATRRFELVARNAIPSPLQLTPSNAGSPRGVPVNVTATATNTDGVPYAGRALRYTITGANPAGGVLTLDANGQGTITDPGANAGGDTIVAYVDFNNDGTRQEAEPQASSLATFVDSVAPTCSVKVSGDRPGGSGGAGKPLKITVSCNESATVTVATTLQVPRKLAGKSTADAAKKKKRKKKKPIKIRLKTTSTVAAPGQAVPVRISISKKVRRKYAGRKVKATVTITATDASGNVKKVTRSRSIKLAKLKKKKAKKRG